MDKYKINESFVINKEVNDDGETDYVAFNMDNGHILLMNSSSYEIYNLFKTGADEDSVISVLINRYKELTDDELKAIKDIISSMIEKNMLKIA